MGTAAPTKTASCNQTVPVSDTRREAVDKARQTWIHKLIDLSRRNNLLYYRPLKTGTLDLSPANAQDMAALMSGAESVSLNKLLPNDNSDSITNLARSIARRAQANSEEKGLQTLFIVLEMATWPADDGGRPADAPILLFPVNLETKGSRSFSIVRAGTVQINLVLLHVLETQFGVTLNPDDLFPHLLGDDEGEPFNPEPFYSELRRRASEVPGFEVKPCAILGNFTFQKMAMVKDLQEHGKELAAHDIVAAVAGDKEARRQVGAQQQNIDPKEFDRISPDNEFIVLDADSSQQCAIASILVGQNAVVHGPPGTGKSQTIANLIASLAATGPRVLFVAEKRAALEVVLRRLREVGLIHLAIDLHGADLSPKKVMQQVADALDKVRNATPVEAEKVHKQLVDRRAKLNEHVERLHSKRQPTGLSIYAIVGRILRLGDKAKTSTRWRGENLNKIKEDVAERIRDLLGEAAGFESLFLRIDPLPWTGANLPDGPAVERALDLARRANTQTFPTFLTSIHAILQQSGLKGPNSMGEARQLLNLVTAVNATLQLYRKEIYTQDHFSLLRDLERGRSGGVSVLQAWHPSQSFLPR